MKTVIFTFTENGINLARKLKNSFEWETTIYSTEKLSGKDEFPIKHNLKEVCRKAFFEADNIIFISACGIAVRTISPFIKDKKIDPAVIVIDELGKFCIPILSGHIGGANKLCREICEKTGAVPVITTATDINNKFSCDTFAEENNLFISDMEKAKIVSAEILNKDVSFKSDFDVFGELPQGLTENSTETGIYITYRTIEPFKNTLRLIPKVITLGIGCRKGTEYDKISYAVNDILNKYGISEKAVKSINSIDLKKEEAGLIKMSEELNVPFNTFSTEELADVKGQFTSSEFVQKITGVDNVCERSVVVSGDEIIVPKTKYDGVTVAVGLSDWSVKFE